MSPLPSQPLIPLKKMLPGRPRRGAGWGPFPKSPQRRENLGRDSVCWVCICWFGGWWNQNWVWRSLSGWLLTTVRRPPAACMGTGTRDGGQRTTWGMESVLPFFVIFTKFLFFCNVVFSQVTLPGYRSTIFTRNGAERDESWVLWLHRETK